MDEEAEPSNDFLRAFARGIRVIRAFGADAPAMTLSEVAARTGLTRANARRILLTLQTLGYVSLDGRQFSLRPSVLEIGYAYLSSLGPMLRAQPLIDALVERTQMPCNLAMLDGTDIIYVLRSSTTHHPPPPVPVNVGRRFPAYATPMGRVLLAGLPVSELDAYLRQTEFAKLTDKTVTNPQHLRTLIEADGRRGWSLVVGEQADWVASIGVPVTEPSGKVVAAIGIGWRAGSVSDTEMADSLLPELIATARAISELATP